MITRWLARALTGALILAAASCSSSTTPSSIAAVPSTGPLPPEVSAASDDGVDHAARGDHRSSVATDAPSTQPSTAQHEQLAEGDLAVTLRSTLSHARYTRAAPAALLLKVDYAATRSAIADRPPLNIALVLDRSGSMAEDRKFPHAIEAARLAIENLSDRDIVSLVAFNQEVVVLSAAGRVVNKPFLYHRLTQITPDGTTDLSAGLLEGIAQVNSRWAEGQVRHVMLLTDGVANQGITDHPALRAIVEKARAKGIGLSTFGCGNDFDEKNLTEMAAAGGGRYTFVKSAEQIPAAFQQELHGLLQVVAQNLAVHVTITGGRIRKVYGQSLEQPTKSWKINLGSLRAAERGVILMQLQPNQFDGDAKLDADVRITFDDPQAGERLQSVARASASFAPEASAAQLGEDQGVIAYGMILGALEQAQAAMLDLDPERYRQARASFDQSYEPARQRALQVRDQQLLNETFLLRHFMDMLAAAEQDGMLNANPQAQQTLQREAGYQRYLLTHPGGAP